MLETANEKLEDVKTRAHKWRTAGEFAAAMMALDRIIIIRKGGADQCVNGVTR